MSLAILACTGLDKPEGSVAREVAIQLAEEAGAEIICPVVLNRTPARYKKALAENRLIVVDGCATQCAGKLAAAAEKKPVQKLIVSDILKKSGRDYRDRASSRCRRPRGRPGDRRGHQRG